jgi:hypothetical protein
MRRPAKSELTGPGFIETDSAVRRIALVPKPSTEMEQGGRDQVI